MNIKSDDRSNRPLLIVISGPSGVGKDTVIQYLAKDTGRYYFIITATTRKPRMGEVEGINHHFLSHKLFSDWIKDENKGFLEWAEVYGECYGTPKSQVRDALSKNMHTIARVDIQGAKSIRLKVPNALLIFIKPPDMEALRTRLIKRGTNSAEDVERRLKEATYEMLQAHWFDYSVVNASGNVEKTAVSIASIVDHESKIREPISL